MSLLAHWLLFLGLVAGYMGVLWLVQRRTGDAGIVDVGWTFGVGLAAAWFAAIGDGDPFRRILLVACAGTWSLRLGVYIFLDRIKGKEEDRRYRTLREKWGDHAQRNFFFFFEAQALIVGLCALPALVISHYRAPLGFWDAAGVAVFIASIVGESIADRQLQRFRADPSNRGTTCRLGLWQYSRHPNYFFEWLHWWAYVLMAVGATGWILTLVGPVMMLFFLFKVTGIPATEAQAVKSRGDDYRRYQRTTSVFIPWFPKHDAS